MNGTATFVGGVNVTNTMTCEEACNGQCCVGGYVKTLDLTSIPYNLDAEVFRGACDGLTASICRDDETCMGAEACTDANIVSIYLGCGSAKSCNKAGNNGGFIGRISNSCNLGSSCFGAASNGGYIGSIVNSCNEGDEACYNAAYIGGNINSITNSCNGASRACYEAAHIGGNINSITGSCNNAHYGCANAAFNGGNITSVSDSCNNGAANCHSVSYNGGNITSIVNSCNDAERACYGAALEGAIEGGILNGCNSESSCEFSGCGRNCGPLSGPIASAIENCCNNERECYGVNETSLLEVCGTVLPWDDTDIRDTSSWPSSQPSVLKWKSPDPSTGTPEDPIMEIQSNIVNKSTVPWLEDEDEADVVENLAEDNQVNSASV